MNAKNLKLIKNAGFALMMFLGFYCFTPSLFAQSKKTSSDNPSYEIHTMKKHETLLGVAKKFHTTPEELLKLNPGLPPNNIKRGTEIRVPVVTAEIKKRDKERKKMLKHAITYKVGKQEALSTIARKNNTDVKTLMLWNDLSTPSVEEGQKLIVGFRKPRFAPKMTTANEEILSNASKKVLITQQGAGGKINGANDSGNYYALHPSVPNGTLITVKNIMNSRSITVKVIGKLPPTQENQGIIIRLSPSATKALNILDEKYRVELSYMGIPAGK